MAKFSTKYVLRLALLVALLLPIAVSAQRAMPSPNWLSTLIEETAPEQVPIWGYKVIDEYPHDPLAFTQGLVLQDDVIYEGTGRQGHSSLRVSDLDTGEVIQAVDLDDRYFGEGIVQFDGRIYQLTWKSGVAFVYDQNSFQQVDQFYYDGEGWGLTTNGQSLIMSNGSNTIVFRDPETFAIERTIAVNDGSLPVTNLNELEWVEGEIWANIWQTDHIVRIDPETGAILGWIDLTGLLPLAPNQPSPGVLNGIAYDPENERLLVTGKNWPTIFQIELNDQP